MKAVVLARGLGRRMRAPDATARLDRAQEQAADHGAKALMPIAGRPLVSHLLDSLRESGVDAVGLVVRPEDRGIADVPLHSTLTITAVLQPEPRGTADAVLAAEAWAGRDPFLVVNGDNLYPRSALANLVSLGGPGLAVFSVEALVGPGGMSRERVGAFAAVAVDARGRLLRIVEKPGANADSATVEGAGAGRLAGISMNCWRFDSRIFDACRAIAPSSRGELELPSAVMCAIAQGVTFQAVAARGPALDVSQRSDVGVVERILRDTPEVLA